MPRPFTLRESVKTPEGLLELRQRGDRDFMISIGGRVLMTSVLRNSEVELAQLGCAPIADRKNARVLVGGLGLGFTLRAALDALPADARVVVAEINPVVVRWCRGPLAVLTEDSLADPRVSVVEEDVTKVIRGVVDSPEEPRFDAAIWDLYRGPGFAPELDYALYGPVSIERTFRALARSQLPIAPDKVRLYSRANPEQREGAEARDLRGAEAGWRAARRRRTCTRALEQRAAGHDASQGSMECRSRRVIHSAAVDSRCSCAIGAGSAVGPRNGDQKRSKRSCVRCRSQTRSTR
jgi:hypothetical protein